MITVTASAVKHLQTLLHEQPENAGKGLRVLVESGGCAGMQYGMGFDEAKEGDQTILLDGVAVHIDAQSAGLLEGATIDFQDELSGAGFRILNPNATRSCGCGSSFEPEKPQEA